jgi:hypothetical protein
VKVYMTDMAISSGFLPRLRESALMYYIFDNLCGTEAASTQKYHHIMSIMPLFTDFA